MRRWTMTTRAATVTLVAAGVLLPLAPASSADGWTIRTTCKTPQGFRQLSPSSCLNSVRDPTQTYTATVRNGHGTAVAGVRVHFSDGTPDAHFRVRTATCTTNAQGRCSSELKADHPRNGEVVHTTATLVVTGTEDGGKLVFTNSF